MGNSRKSIMPTTLVEKLTNYAPSLQKVSMEDGACFQTVCSVSRLRCAGLPFDFRQIRFTAPVSLSTKSRKREAELYEHAFPYRTVLTYVSVRLGRRTVRYGLKARKSRGSTHPRTAVTLAYFTSYRTSTAQSTARTAVRVVIG